MKAFLVTFFFFSAVITFGIGYFYFTESHHISTVKDSSKIHATITYKDLQKSKEDIIKQDALWYNTAIEEKNLSYCEKIEDIEKKQNCRDMVLAILALDSMNTNGCSPIVNSEIKEQCRERILEKNATNSSDKSLCESIESPEVKTRCKNSIDEKKLQLILTEGPLTETICKSLEQEFQATCLDALQRQTITSLSQNAIQGNNLDGCDAITTENEKILCLDTINLKNALTTNDVTLCEKIIDPKKKNYCETVLSRALEGVRYREYITTNNLEGCSTLQEELLMKKCQETVIFSRVRLEKNPVICEKLTGTGLIATCKSLLD